MFLSDFSFKIRREKEGTVKRIRMCYIPMPAAHNEYNYALQTCTDKNEN